jgi:uncharacterized protein YkwD
VRFPNLFRFVAPILFLGCLCLTANAQGKGRTPGVGPLGGPLRPPAPAFPKSADILAEINLARTNPTKYATYLEAMRTQFTGKTFKRPDGVDIVTTEGVAAVDEAIRFLRAAKPLVAFQLSNGMSRGAADQATDLALNDRTGHLGSDGSSPEERCGRYGRLVENTDVGENIAYEGATAREIVIGFIVDDGTENRGHRRNVFSSSYKIAGVGRGSGANVLAVYVVTFANGYTEKPVKSSNATAARQM